LFQERLFDPDAEACIGFIQEVISSIRNLRAEKNIPPSKGGSVLIQVEDSNKEKWLTKMEGAVKVLSRTKTLTLEKGGKKPKSAAAAVTAGVNIFLDLEGLIDRAVEKKKIEKEIEKAKSFQASVKKKLSNEKFMHNAPEAVVAREKAKLMTAQERIEKLKENLKLFE
jgi:valyl-tRNA synthetase